MKIKNRISGVVFLFLFVFLNGCSNIIYIPSELEKVPKEQLSRIDINTQHKNLSIDNVHINSKKIIYVRPGDHELFGEMNLVAREWINHKAQREKMGWRYDPKADAFFKGNEARVPEGIPRFGFYKHNLTIESKAGKTYNITDFSDYLVSY